MDKLLPIPMRIPILTALFMLVGFCASVKGAEYTYSGTTLSGTAYSNTVYWDDSLASGQIKGVVVTFNYGATVFNDAAWRNFCRERGLALLLMVDQDYLANTTEGVNILQATLNSVSTQSGRSDIKAGTLAYTFIGVSRGGTLGAIDLGWQEGKDKTVACIAYHGNSFNYLPASFPSASSTIPVLYPMAQLDSGPYRQTDIEAAVRTTNGITDLGIGPPYPTYGMRPKYGMFWTTTMQYGSSHSSVGDDIYPLQWLGRVWDARFNAATAGTLSAITTAASLDGTYNLINGASSTAYFGGAAAIAFAQKDSNVWVPASGSSEWVAASSLPQTGTTYNIDSTYNSIYFAPENIVARSFVNAGSITFTGSGTITLDDAGTGNPVGFAMTGGTLQLIHRVVLRNGSHQGGVWTANAASIFIDATSVLDLYNGNPVYASSLVGSGSVTISSDGGVNWAGARTLTLGVNGGAGVFSGSIAGNAATHGGSISLIKIGAGTQALNGLCTYSGSTWVSAGTLALGGTIFATSGVEISSNAVLQLQGGLLASGTIHIAAGGILGGSGTVTAQVINDGSALFSSGTVRFAGG